MHEEGHPRIVLGGDVEVDVPPHRSSGAQQPILLPRVLVVPERRFAGRHALLPGDHPASQPPLLPLPLHIRLPLPRLVRLEQEAAQILLVGGVGRVLGGNVRLVVVSQIVLPVELVVAVAVAGSKRRRGAIAADQGVIPRIPADGHGCLRVPGGPAGGKRGGRGSGGRPAEQGGRLGLRVPVARYERSGGVGGAVAVEVPVGHRGRRGSDRGQLVPARLPGRLRRGGHRGGPTAVPAAVAVAIAVAVAVPACAVVAAPVPVAIVAVAIPVAASSVIILIRATAAGPLAAPVRRR